MKKTKRIEPYKVYEVKSFVKARNAMEARKLSKATEPHEITLMRQKTVEGHASFTDAVGYLETPPEWEDDDIHEYNVGYEKTG